MIGLTISHYKILEKLGQGGMGVVYKAEDTRLGRIVALKFLHPSLTADPKAKERFIQEAQTASALDHPNICTIHEINETEDGQLYMVMACYEGQTLREKIESDALPTDRAIDITVQIANGLSKAHEKGIVHRDIKPANIFITDDGTVKILDFGLAKFAGHSPHTKTGSTLGTVAYMSPEQAQGLPVDHRTDIWSLGVMLYQMLTGRLPFFGEFDQAVIYRIVNQEPEAIQNDKAEPDAELRHVLHRLLEKEPHSRYQTTQELLIDLIRLDKVKDQLSQKTARKNIKIDYAVKAKSRKSKKTYRVSFSILAVLLIAAVFYFAFISHSEEPSATISLAVADFQNKTNEKQLDGLSDLLITALEQSKSLQIMTRAMMFDILKQMGQKEIHEIDADLSRKICRQGNVVILLTCSIRKLGSNLYTIDLKALDAVNDKFLHADRVQGEGQESVLPMIDQLAANVRRHLQETEKEIKKTTVKIASITTDNFEAYNHYFQGLQLYDKQRYQEAKNEFEKAVKLDSSFSLAYFRLGYGGSLYPDTEEFAFEPLKKAFSLNLPEREQWLARAVITKSENGWQAGIAVLQQMRKRFANDKEMIYRIGDWYFHAGQFDSAAVYLEKAVKMDPGFIRALEHLNGTYEELRRYDKEFEAAKLWITVESSGLACYHFAKAAFLSGNCEQGIDMLDQIRKISPNKISATIFIATIYAHQNEFDKAEAEVKTLITLDQSMEVQRIGNYYLMCIFLYSGRYRQAMAAAEKAKDLSWQVNDAYLAVLSELNQELLKVWSGRSNKNILTEIKNCTRLAKKAEDMPNCLNLGLLNYYTGNDHSADSMAGHTKYPEVKYLHALLRLKHDYTLADSIYNDPTWRAFINHYQVQIFYLLAESFIKLKEFDKALGSLNTLRSKWSKHYERPVFVAKSYLLQARIYEKKGDREMAKASYEKFLAMWKNADPDLPDLIEAKTRLAKLKNITD